MFVVIGLVSITGITATAKPTSTNTPAHARYTNGKETNEQPVDTSHSGPVMSDYAKIWQRIWDDPDFISLDLESQAVFFLLISDPGRNNAGVLPLTLNRWARCSKDADQDTIRRILGGLAARNFIVVDWDYEEVLVRTFIRNDQGYIHPNMHKSVLRSVAKTRSPLLKSVLAEELLRLPDHSGIKSTREAADKLVRGLDQSVRDAIGMPSGSHPDGNAITPVEVVTYLSSKELNLQPQPSTSTLNSNRAGATSITLRDGSTVNVTIQAREIVHSVVKGALLKANKNGLYANTQKLLDDGATPAQLQAVLEEWIHRTDAYPGHLPHIYTELAKRANGATHSRIRTESVTDARIASTQALKARYLQEDETVRGELA